MTTIEIKGKPIAWMRVGVNQGRFYDRQLDERIAYQWMLKQAYQQPPRMRALSLGGEFLFEMPASWPKAKRAEMLGKPHEQVPDLDNLVKWVMDCGKGILWDDDKVITRFDKIDKTWSEESTTIFHFNEINNNSCESKTN